MKFYVYKIGDKFTSLFLIWVIFLSFSCLNGLAGTSSTKLNRNSEYGYFCLISDPSQRVFSLPSLNMMLVVGFFQMTFIRLRDVHSTLSLLSIFIMRGCRTLLNAFVAYWDHHVDFILYSIDMVYYIDWFSDIDPSLHSRNKSLMVMVYHVFYLFLYSVC